MRLVRVMATIVALLLMVAACGHDDKPTGSTGPLPEKSPPDSDPPPDREPGPELSLAQREAKVQRDATGIHSLLDAFWTQELRRLYQINFDPPDRYEFYRTTGNSPCGGKLSIGKQNAYYCFVDGDEFVAYDLDWFQAFLMDHPGGATTFLILAHEWGHAVQDSWLEGGGRDTWDPPYRKELNADCLAAVFLVSAIKNGDITEDADDADAIWNWLFDEGHSGPWLTPSDHGTREQRVAAFTDGATQGTDDCRKRY